MRSKLLAWVSWLDSCVQLCGTYRTNVKVPQPSGATQDEWAFTYPSTARSARVLSKARPRLYSSMMDHLFPVEKLAILAILTLLLLLFRRYAYRTTHLPPSPRGYPLVGSILDVPKKYYWLKYQEWCRSLKSEIVHVNMLGTSVILLDSWKVANELLEKRSSIYSSRPYMPMLNDLIGFDWLFSFMPYGEAWKERRKIFHQNLNASASRQYRPVSLTVTRKLLRRILDDPESQINILSHLRFMAGDFILTITYGIEVKDNDDKFLLTAENAMAAMAAAGNGTNYLVDLFPILKYVPSWFPGAKFKREAKAWRKDVLAIPEAPFELVKANKTIASSIASQLLPTLTGDDNAQHKERVLRDALGGMYVGATDTTVASLGTFVLAMIQFPDVQRKGQEAVDEVLFGDRLPDFSDFGNIPYVDAIVKEVLRWKAVLPLACPHSVMVDDIYNGYLIPAGSTIIPNVWSMLYDESVYGADTHLFQPERFLKDGALNPAIKHPEEAFGFGRRICPGRHVAYDSIWLVVSSLLAAFDISKAMGEDGHVIEPSGEYTTGLVTYPVPFPCTFKPRNPAAAAMI